MTANQMRPLNREPLPAELEAATADVVGLGISDKSADFATPQLKVVQVGSPECDDNDPDFIDGCEPGDLVLPGSVKPVFRGSEGVAVLHCGQTNTFSEFLPGRQGFVERHLERPVDVESRVADSGSKRPVLFRKGTGNLLVETREIYLIAEGIPCVLFCSGTKHMFARRWMSWLAQQMRSDGRVAASFSRRYRLFTVSTKNALGRWYGLQFEDIGPTPLEELPAAKDFTLRVRSGTLRLASPDVA
jgi:hypothetical protein